MVTQAGPNLISRTVKHTRSKKSGAAALTRWVVAAGAPAAWELDGSTTAPALPAARTAMVAPAIDNFVLFDSSLNVSSPICERAIRALCTLKDDRYTIARSSQTRISRRSDRNPETRRRGPNDQGSTPDRSRTCSSSRGNVIPGNSRHGGVCRRCSGELRRCHRQQPATDRVPHREPQVDIRVGQRADNRRGVRGGAPHLRVYAVLTGHIRDTRRAGPATITNSVLRALPARPTFFPLGSNTPICEPM